MSAPGPSRQPVGPGATSGVSYPISKGHPPRGYASLLVGAGGRGADMGNGGHSGGAGAPMVGPGAQSTTSGRFHALGSAGGSGRGGVPGADQARRDERGEEGGGVLLGVESDGMSNTGSCSGESEDQHGKGPGATGAGPGSHADRDKKEKVRAKNEKKHLRQKERRAQELRERCAEALAAHKLRGLVSTLQAMGFPHDRCVLALASCDGSLERAVNWILEGSAGGSGTGASTSAAGMGSSEAELTGMASKMKLDVSAELARMAELESKMGFAHGDVERAVIACEGDVERAAAQLLERPRLSQAGAAANGGAPHSNSARLDASSGTGPGSGPSARTPTGPTLGSREEAAGPGKAPALGLGQGLGAAPAPTIHPLGAGRPLGAAWPAQQGASLGAGAVAGMGRALAPGGSQVVGPRQANGHALAHPGGWHGPPPSGFPQQQQQLHQGVQSGVPGAYPGPSKGGVPLSQASSPLSHTQQQQQPLQQQRPVGAPAPAGQPTGGPGASLLHQGQSQKGQEAGRGPGAPPAHPAAAQPRPSAAPGARAEGLPTRERVLEAQNRTAGAGGSQAPAPALHEPQQQMAYQQSATQAQVPGAVDGPPTSSTGPGLPPLQDPLAPSGLLPQPRGPGGPPGAPPRSRSVTALLPQGSAPGAPLEGPNPAPPFGPSVGGAPQSQPRQPWAHGPGMPGGVGGVPQANLGVVARAFASQWAGPIGGMSTYPHQQQQQQQQQQMLTQGQESGAGVGLPGAAGVGAGGPMIGPGMPAHHPQQQQGLQGPGAGVFGSALAAGVQPVGPPVGLWSPLTGEPGSRVLSDNSSFSGAGAAAGAPWGGAAPFAPSAGAGVGAPGASRGTFGPAQGAWGEPPASGLTSLSLSAGTGAGSSAGGGARERAGAMGTGFLGAGTGHASAGGALGPSLAAPAAASGGAAAGGRAHGVPGVAAGAPNGPGDARSDQAGSSRSSSLRSSPSAVGPSSTSSRSSTGSGQGGEYLGGAAGAPGAAIAHTAEPAGGEDRFVGGERAAAEAATLVSGGVPLVLSDLGPGMRMYDLWGGLAADAAAPHASLSASDATAGAHGNASGSLGVSSVPVGAPLAAERSSGSRGLMGPSVLAPDVAWSTPFGGKDFTSLLHASVPQNGL